MENTRASCIFAEYTSSLITQMQKSVLCVCVCVCVVFAEGSVRTCLPAERIASSIFLGHKAMMFGFIKLKLVCIITYYVYAILYASTYTYEHMNLSTCEN